MPTTRRRPSSGTSPGSTSCGSGTRTCGRETCRSSSAAARAPLPPVRLGRPRSPARPAHRARPGPSGGRGAPAGPGLRPRPACRVLVAAAVVLGYVLSILMASTVALAGFWTTQTTNLWMLWWGLGSFASGWVAPLELLPDWLRTLALVLPFRSTLGFPASRWPDGSTGPRSSRVSRSGWRGAACSRPPTSSPGGAASGVTRRLPDEHRRAAARRPRPGRRRAGRVASLRTDPRRLLAGRTRRAARVPRGPPGQDADGAPSGWSGLLSGVSVYFQFTADVGGWCLRRGPRRPRPLLRHQRGAPGIPRADLERLGHGVRRGGSTTSSPNRWTPRCW